MSLEIKLITQTGPAYTDMLHLRKEVLRQPLGLSLWVVDLSKDNGDLLFVAVQDDKMAGCVILKMLNNEVMKLRAMAVLPQLQGAGIGRMLVQEAETTAIKMGYRYIEMYARVVAIPFYEKLGYNVTSDEFIEVTVPHRKMKKEL